MNQIINSLLTKLQITLPIPKKQNIRCSYKSLQLTTTYFLTLFLALNMIVNFIFFKKTNYSTTINNFSLL